MRGWGSTVAVLLALGAQAEAARLTVTASRTEALYAQDDNADCSNLSKLATADLPFHVVRLSVDSPVTDGTVRYRWSEPPAGAFAADLDLGTNDETRLIRSLATELGNSCLLTGESLALYDRPTILWIAPTCAVLPADTTRPYPGDRVRFSVQALQGKRRLGKGSVTVGYGRLASAKMLVSDPPLPFSQFRDGHGKPNGELIFINTAFGGAVDLKGQVLPAVQQFEFDSGDGGTVSDAPPCDDPNIAPTGLDACAIAPLYDSGGKHLAKLQVSFADGSALCDNLTVNVRVSEHSVELDVSTTPPARTFTPGDPIKGNPFLRVRAKNTSPAGVGGGVLFVGNVLECLTEARVNGTTLTRTTRMDLQHCSATISQACNTDGDCQLDRCPTCQQGERCLTSDHCSGNFDVGCTTDRECERPQCGACGFGETCVKVLPLASVFLSPGDSFDIFEGNVSVANVLTSPARIKETWTVHPFNAADATDLLRYKIKSRPEIPPPGTP